MNGIKSLIDNVVYLDIETTGLSDSLDDENMRKWERIIEIGAVKYKDGEYSEFHTLVNPRKKLSLDILDLCSGISQDALDKSPTIKDIFPCLVDFIEDMPLICHNAAFEKKFLSTYGKALGYELKNEFLDSMELAALVNPGLKEYNLEALIKEYI
ncbi:3'-5' exonuclease, partial [Inconstantimicrobium porci]